MKKCSKCGETKHEELFSWKVAGVKRNGFCKDCHSQYRREHYLANKEKYVKKARDWKKSNPYARYSLSVEEYNSLLESQNRKCAICHRTKTLYVDHDHSCCPGPQTCGKCIRGLLCINCNTSLGKFDDSIDILMSAVAYLSSRQ